MSYDYSSGSWGDLLTSYWGNSITYDGVGNPLTWGDYGELTWQGRRLMSYSDSESGDDYSYTYNADGIRTSKTVNGVKHTYHLSGTQILSEEWTDRWNRHVMVYIYDAAGQPIGMSYFRGGTLVDTYLYEKNIQGDVVAVYEYDGDLVVRYAYNAWGAVSETEYGSEYCEESFEVLCNPFRYRGYYYDTETGFYYVSSRYYDPEVGRWINADSAIGQIGNVQSTNMFSYCFNNPVNMSDPSGNWPKWATKLVAAVAVVAVVAAVAAVTVATAGAGTAIAAVAVGAAKGAAIGFAVGAASGAAIGYATTGTLEGTLNGMADGALSGSISGAITGGVNGYSNYSSAANFLKSNGANPKEVLSSYKGTPKVQTLKTDTTVYRTWGGTTQELGHWVSPNNYGSSARNLLSLPTGNTMTNASSFLLPKGTTVLAGKAALLFGQSGGGVQWWISVLG